MSEELKLLPCPFCGGKAFYRKWDNGYCQGFNCQCDKCDCKLSFETEVSLGNAVAAWNTRPAPVIDEGMVARCVEAMREYCRSELWAEDEGKVRAVLQAALGKEG